MAFGASREVSGVSGPKALLASLLPFEKENFPLKDVAFTDEVRRSLGFDPSKLKRFRFTPERLFELCMLEQGVFLKDKTRFHKVLSQAGVNVPDADFLHEGFSEGVSPSVGLSGLKPGEHLDGLVGNLGVRAGMLENGGRIVVKPRSGSRALGVAFLSLSENRENLVVRSSDPDLHKKLREVFTGDFGAVEGDLTQDSGKGVSLIKVKSGGVRGALAMFEWIAYPLFYGSKDRLVEESGNRVWTLAEGHIDEPLYGPGCMWEARFIVQDAGEGHEVAGSYAKRGYPRKAVANISEGGKIYEIEPIVSRVYKTLRPKAEKTEIAVLTDAFMQECRRQSVVAVEALEADLRQLQASQKPDYPLPVRISHMSVDFMGERYLDSESGVKMRPVVVDVNSRPYYSGLVVVDSHAALRVDSNLRVIHKETIDALAKLAKVS